MKWIALVLALAAGLCLPAAAGAAVNSSSQLISTGPAGGNGPYYSDFSGVPETATRALFWTKESLTGTDADSSIDLYERSGASTTLVSTGPAGGNGAYAMNYGKTNATGTKVFFATNEQLTADDTDDFQDVYERSGGVTTLLSKGTTGGNGAQDAFFAGSSSDGSHVWFETSEQLVSSDTDTFRDVYERYAGNTTLISTGPDGGNGDFMSEWAGASADGSKVFVHTDESLVAEDTDGVQDVYQRSAGTTILISTGTTTSIDPDVRAVFRFVSADGSRVIFNTREQLTSADTDNGPDVYERVNGTTTNLLSIGAQSPVPDMPATFAYASQDGTKVYFETAEKLFSSDLDPYTDVYLRSGGTTVLASGGGPGLSSSNAFAEGVSDDGTKMFFRSEEKLTASDTDPSDDIYQFDSTTGTRTLLSGGTQDADVHPATNSADGNDVFFYTFEPLVASDTDTSVDLYERTGGNIYLISTGPSGGNGPYDVTYSGATPDGKRVFFRTKEQLTPQDTDNSDDVYSADVGGQVNVVLDSTPDDPQNFTFTIGGGLSLGLGGGSSFDLDDDSDPALSNTRSFTNVSPGTGYSVSQSIPAGWDQTGASCDNGSSPAAIQVAPAETVTCTFTNRKRGRIVVVQDSIPDDPQDFSYTAGGGLSPASFVLDDDADPTRSNTISFDDLTPGAGYSLSQTAVTGWALTGLMCSDGSPVSNIDVSPGETVTCTFTNRKRGSLVIVKDAQPNDPQDFQFTTTGGLAPSTFSLDDDSDPTLSNTRAFHNLSNSATFSVTETVPPGWGQLSATCDNGNPVTAINVPFNTTVTCTFTNATTGQIVVTKDSTPDDPQDFSFTAGGGLSPSSFSLDDDSDGTLSNTRTFVTVPSGSGYSLSETVPSGWDQTSAICSDGSAPSNISVSAGEIVNCTFANRKRGKIILVEDSMPDDPQDFAFTAGGGLSPSSFSLDDDANATLSNTQTFNNVVPGSGYSLAESVPSGWDQTSATCSDGSSVANVDVSAGETVTCTFSNTKRGQIIAVKDAVPNDPQDFAFTAGGGLSPSSFSLDDDSDGTLSNTQTFNNVPPGSGYSLSEAMPAGWIQSSATCNDGSSPANIVLSPGEVVTCNWVNTKGATLTVVKNAVPDDPQDFSFTAGGGLSPGSFSLDDDADGTLSNSRTFSTVAPGSGYSLSEAVPSGWDQTSATCSDGSAVSNVNLSAGENVTCTFTNTKRGSLVIVEDSQPDDAQDFTYTSTGGLSPSTFSLDDDTNATLSNTRTFSNITPGSYSVTQGANPSGWNLSGATCDNGNSPSSITVAAGQTVTCTFTNKKQGSIVLVHDFQPGTDGQDFTYTAGGGLTPASVILDDDPNPTRSNTQTYTNVVAQGGYSITQNAVAGFVTTSATCDNGNSPGAIAVAAAQTVTCTFVVQRAATLNIVKDAVPDDSQDFNFTAGAPLSPTSFQLDDDTNGALSNTRQFANLVPGTYNVGESSIPAGWDLASATCSDGSPVTAIVLSANETTTCTFTNNKRGSLVAVKDAQPNDPQDFPFTAGGGLTPGSFTLDDDSDPVLSNTQTYSNIPTGSVATYSLAESVPAAWAQTAGTCSDGDSPTAINITPGTTLTCTFTNKLRGQINIVKDSTPDDPQDFSFTAAGGLSPASFSLDDDADGTLSNTRSFTGVTPQAGYSVAEAVPTGWDQTAATCSDGSPVSNIDVGSGETVTCTFANRKRGRLVVVQDSTPNDAQDFAFSASTTAGSVNFSLDDDSDPTLANSRTFANLVPGSAVSISQTVPSGWDQTSIVCDDGSPPSAVDLQPGETVTCTFNDRKRGQIIAVKDAIPDDPQDFSFTAGGGLSPTSFQLDDDANATLSNSRTFANVVPGTGYSLSETVPTGWDQTSATCSDGSPLGNIDVSPGETVTCNWVNSKRASLTVVKDAQPNDPQDFAFTAGGGLSPASFSLDDDADATLSNTRTYSNLPPGSGYSISEQAQAGWDLGSATCSDGSPVSNVSLSVGEDVTCTFTNNKRGTIVVVKDAQPNDPQDFSFTTGGGLSPSSFSLDDDSDGTLSNTQTITNVVAGNGYSVAESVPSGWDQSSATCDDGSPVTNISVSGGETVTCTFTNRKRGQINIVKDSTPDDPQDFSFTTGGGLSPSSFSLDDDADGTLSNTRSFTGVTPQAGYSVAESVPAGWDQTAATCSDGSPVSNIDVAPGETVTCTFANRKRGKIVAIKDATPNDPQDFAFTAGGGLSPASFNLDDDANATLSNTQTYNNVVPGSGYSLSETVPGGWDQTSATCDDGSSPANIDVAAGETVTCTFANSKRGQIIAVKDAVPNDPQDFAFTAGGGLSPAGFSLDDDADGTLSNTQTFTNVVPGAGYTLNEALPSGWDQTSATCSDGSPVSNIDVAPGETVTCTWVNTKRASLTVTKDAVPNDPQDFAFNIAVPGDGSLNFSLDDDSDPALANSRTFNNVAPASGYVVSETVPGGWDQSGATCDDGSPVTNVSLSPGESVECTFTNQMRGRIVVVKQATPSDPQDFSFTTGGGLSPGSFVLDDDADPARSNTQTISNVAVGSGYSVAETVPSGWDQTSATCDDGSPITNISVGPDETVTCTFANRKRGRINVVKDAQPNDPQDFAFTSGGGLSPASFNLDDDSNGTLPNTQSFTNVVPGSGYSVAETVPGGWDQSSATCDDGSPVSDISVAAGETVTCTFVNSKRGQIVVVKDATPDDPQDFSFAAGGGLSPASFQLDDDSNPTLSNTRTFGSVLPGSGYSVAETVPSGWDQTSATCSDGSPISNIDVSEGEIVTCTFANRKRGQINVVKDATPNDPQDFSFTTSGGLPVSSFDLDDDSDGTLSSTQAITNVVPSAGYGIQETVPSGWDQTSATCSDGSPVSNVDVAPGEVVTCTFANRKRAVLTVTKNAVPGDPQDFDFTVAVPGNGSLNFSLDDDSDPTLANSRTFNNVVPNSGYVVTETVPAGWDQSSATCDDGSAPSNVTLSPGEHVTCNFTNQKRGRIVVVKDSTPADPQDFTFTTGGGLSPASFQLDDDANPTLSNTQSINNVAVGSGYSVSETVPTGWDQTAASCDDGSPVTNIDVGPDETVTCTFHNRKRGQINIVKDATPNDAQDFAFTAGGGLSPAGFSLDDDSNGTASNTQTFSNVVPGSGYSVAETVPGGWDQTSATCSDGSPVSNIDVAAGEVVTCTFANRKRASLTVVKQAQPNDPQDFSFVASVPGDGTLNFSLDDDSDATLPNTRTFSNLVPANGYTVAETVPPGWDQSAAVCDDGSSPASINLTAGESVTCTFTNVKRGNIVIVKDAQPDDPQDFTFTAGGGLSPASVSLDDDSDPTLPNAHTFSNLLPGSGYSVSESVPAGWSLGSATCDDGSPVSNISVSAGETVTCTWTNLRHGQIHVIKDAQPNDPQNFAFTAGGGLSPASFTLDDDSDPALANTQSFTDVAPGSGYTVSEATPAGWDLSSATCDDGSPTFNISVSAGEVVTCTFTNVKRGQIVVTKDAQPNDPQDFSFSAGGGLSPASFSLDDDSDGTLSNSQTFGNVAPGTYSVSEQATSGWVQDSATCDDGSSPSSIDVGPGETVHCTFTNSRKGQLVVVKDAQPNDPQDFSFTAGGGLSPASFSLDDDSDGTLSNTRTFSSINPGSGYALAESIPSGWDQTGATCDDGSPIANISISAGETVTCTFTNRKRGQIVVVKDAQPNDPQDFSFTAGGGLSPASFSLDDDSDATLSNTRTFSNVVPGSGYSVSEALPANWSQSGASCSDGSPVTNIDVSSGETVTCTFTNIRGYPRPKAATPVNLPFVNAYNACPSPNRAHAAPLTYGSCNPGTMSSSYLTSGTPDANSRTANFIGNVLLRTISGDPNTPADEAEVTVDVNAEDVRTIAGLNDYTGQLGLELPLKITDRSNGPSGTEIGTVQTASIVVPVPCVATGGTGNVGSTCQVSTTVDSVIPGSVTEQKRAIWELGTIQLLDGGADGLVSTNDNTVFARQGVFVP